MPNIQVIHNNLLTKVYLKVLEIIDLIGERVGIVALWYIDHDSARAMERIFH